MDWQADLLMVGFLSLGAILYSLAFKEIDPTKGKSKILVHLFGWFRGAKYYTARGRLLIVLSVVCVVLAWLSNVVYVWMKGH